MPLINQHFISWNTTAEIGLHDTGSRTPFKHEHGDWIQSLESCSAAIFHKKADTDMGTKKTTRTKEAQEADTCSGNDDTIGDVNMEAVITKSDVVQAGGLGARDDIGSVVPIATDSTDFEASLLDVWDFEAPKEETQRPGLGWTEAKKSASSSPAIPQ